MNLLVKKCNRCCLFNWFYINNAEVVIIHQSDWKSKSKLTIIILLIIYMKFYYFVMIKLNLIFPATEILLDAIPVLGLIFLFFFLFYIIWLSLKFQTLSQLCSINKFNLIDWFNYYGRSFSKYGWTMQVKDKAAYTILLSIN